MEALSNLNAVLPPAPNPPQSYGTAGFRGDASLLHSTIFRCGVLAAARSHILSARPVGVMITASHNPPQHNGLKLIEPDGSMLVAPWESLAARFVNATDNPAAILNAVVPVAQLVSAADALVVVGRDTRHSSPQFFHLLSRGVQAVGGSVIDLGLVSTPQLHFAVHMKDAGHPSSLDHYFHNLTSHFQSMISHRRLLSPLVIDCANGVGYKPMSEILHLLQSATLINAPGHGPLNQACGADFVQKNRLLPTVYSEASKLPSKHAIWASLDGDADRLVMYQPIGDSVLLADGDRFAALVSTFISKHLHRSSILTLSVGVVQTAYSNGAATQFLEQLKGVEVLMAKTGVKHLEKEARRVDIGIYWEPNGHGTVLFSQKAVSELEKCKARFGTDTAHSEKMESIAMLLTVSKLANQAIGDGIADLLLILGILSCEDITFDSWIRMYDERCSYNMVVRVSDKNVITTEQYDCVVKTPVTLRKAVLDAMRSDGCRAFVRPSGTEDVVRVYAEAPCGWEGKAKEMATTISRAVYDFCNGVGERP